MRLELLKKRVGARDAELVRLDRTVARAEKAIGDIGERMLKLEALTQTVRELRSDVEAIAKHVGFELGMSTGANSTVREPFENNYGDESEEPSREEIEAEEAHEAKKVK